MKIICKLKYGSHLYGTSTPTSDIDIKGIYLPSLDNYLMQDVRKSITNNQKNSDTLKNQAGDIDEKYYSLNYFIKLALKGDTIAIDMLHSPNSWEDVTSEIWEDLKTKRSLFYSKNLKSYVGYCRKQAAKYSCRGSRLDAAKQVIDFCIKNHATDKNKRIKIGSFFQPEYYLPQNDYSKISLATKDDGSLDWQNSYYHILEKRFSLNDTLDSMLRSLTLFYEAYGARAKLASENMGIDHKSIHHAFRVGLQMKEILQTGDLKYPLKDKEFLLKIKKGEYHYINDGISNMLDKLVDEVKLLADNADLPENADEEFWHKWLLRNLKKQLI